MTPAVLVVEPCRCTETVCSCSDHRALMRQVAAMLPDSVIVRAPAEEPLALPHQHGDPKNRAERRAMDRRGRKRGRPDGRDAARKRRQKRRQRR